MAFLVLRDAKPDRDWENEGGRRRLCWSQPSPELSPLWGIQRTSKIKVWVILGGPVESRGVRAHSRGLVVVTLVAGLGGPVPARL